MCEEIEVGEVREVAPGVLMTRRSLVWTAAWAFALTLPACAARTKAISMASSASALTFDEFLSEANPLSRGLVGDTTATGQSRYLTALAGVAARVRTVPVPELRDSGQGETPGSFIGSNPGGDVFNVLHWKLAPGARLRPHAHTYGTVVTLGLEGEATVENYEVDGVPDFATSGPIRVRRTGKQKLVPGDVNLVSLEKDYIHGFVGGPNGARGLDITTRLKPRAPTPYLIIKDGASRNGLIEARWSLDNPLPSSGAQ